MVQWMDNYSTADCMILGKATLPTIGKRSNTAEQKDINRYLQENLEETEKKKRQP